ncbi:MAG: nickel pincer cofactor biosynthesis protein LarB [Methanobacteriota archaeon]
MKPKKAGNHLLDGGRAKRTGLPEVVFAPSKNDRALVASIRGLAKHHDVLVTKCSQHQLEVICGAFGSKVLVSSDDSGVAVVKGAGKPLERIDACIAIVSAGSSDHRIAEEAALCVEYLGLEALRLYDRGVAGLHRARNAARECERKGARAVIAVAGMEGTLPSVLAGLLKIPIVAVPTSVGYGTGLGGLAAMSTMLNSCSPGILVVNIDNGFGAAAAVRKFLNS